jgi:transcriptional regulator with XRE-family HTH domain
MQDTKNTLYMTAEEFIRNLKKFREERDISCQELGERTAISPTYINRLELGVRQNPGLKISMRLAEEFGVRIVFDSEVSELGTEFQAVIRANDFCISKHRVTDEEKEEIIKIVNDYFDNFDELKSIN